MNKNNYIIITTFLDCRKNQIALRDTEITDETIVLCGDLTSEIVQKWIHFPKNLIFIKGDANFIDSQVEDLGNLRRIEGGADFENAPIRNLGELKERGIKCYVSRKNKELIRLLKERSFEDKIIVIID